VGYLVQVGSVVDQATPEQSARPWFASELVWQVLVLFTVVAWLYGSIIANFVRQWLHDPNFSHGFFVPAFSLFVLWRNRASLKRKPHEPSSWGLLIVVAGLCTLAAGVMGAELFLSRISLLLVTAGLVIFFRGWVTFRAVLFPWAFLILMIPIPAIVFNQIALPLQLLGSKIAAWTLPVLGIPVLQQGNIIQLPTMPLEVAEACSGIRSLLSLATLSIIYGYLSERSTANRVLLALASVPIAVLANSARIVATGGLVHYLNPEAARGFFHLFSGWLMFLISFVMLFALHQLLRFTRNAREVKG
jgi:exosortase